MTTPKRNLPMTVERHANGTATGPVKLGDLIAESKLLWAYCRDCGHERDLDPSSLPLPHDMPVPTVGTRLICSHCGSREITTWPELYPDGVAAKRRTYV